MTQPDNRQTIIDVSKSTKARSFASDEKYFLQKEVYEKLRDLVRHGLDSVDESAKEKRQQNRYRDCASTQFYEERGHYSILVDGSRGSGKTTFALTALQKLEDESKGDYLSLGVLDPTLIDSREHVLLAVISKIKDLVTEQQRKYSAYGEPSCFFEKTGDPLATWHTCLKQLAGGLRELRNVDKKIQTDVVWEDAVTILGEGLEGIQAGLGLNQRLHTFIDESLKALKAKAFVLVLDDIDTFFESGWPVLEALRKYLTSPKLITVVCGDLRLYETLVRKNQWSQLGKLATTYESSEYSRKKHETMVSELTDQYMMKILPAERRLALLTVSELGEVLVKEGEASESSLSTVLEDMIFQSFGVAGGTREARQYKAYFNRQPLRSFIQLLEMLNQDNGKKSSQYRGMGACERPKSVHRTIPLSAVTSVFAEWVYSTSGDTRVFQNVFNNPMIVQQVLECMQKNGLLMDDLELLPHYTDELKNAGSAALGRLLDELFWAQPYMGLDYMLRGGLTRHALYYVGEQDESRPSDTLIMHALGANTSDDLLSVARQWSSVVVHGLNEPQRKGLNLGTIQILAESSIRKNRSRAALRSLYRTKNPALVRALVELEISAHIFTDHKKSKHGALGAGMRYLHEYYQQYKLPEQRQHYAISPLEVQHILQQQGHADIAKLVGVVFSEVLDSKGHYYRASAFNLIALAAMMLEMADFQGADSDDGHKLEEQVLQVLQKAGQLRTFTVPVGFSMDAITGISQSTATDEADEEEEEDPPIDEGDEGSQEDADRQIFARALGKWLIENRGLREREGGLKVHYPPVVWSRIWSRFFHTVERIEQTLPTHLRYVGVILQRQIVAFLNAVLVEEARYLETINADWKGKRVSLQNPVLADTQYKNNIDTVKDEFLPLYDSLRSNPIFLTFLDEDVVCAEVWKENSEWLSLEGSGLKVQESVRFIDLLNLIPLANVSERSLPNFWNHAVLCKEVLSDKDVRKVVGQGLKGVTTYAGLKGYITDNLASTATNPATLHNLKSIIDKSDGTKQ